MRGKGKRTAGWVVLPRPPEQKSEKNESEKMYLWALKKDNPVKRRETQRRRRPGVL